MSFDRTPNFTEKLATDPDFRLKVLDEIANDDELKDLTEEDLKAIVGRRRLKSDRRWRTEQTPNIRLSCVTNIIPLSCVISFSSRI